MEIVKYKSFYNPETGVPVDALTYILNEFGLFTPDDLIYVLHQYQKVITELSHGMLSKFTYSANDLIKVFREKEWFDYDIAKPDKGQKVLVWFEYFRYGDYNCPYQTYGIMEYPYDNIIDGSTGWRDLKIIKWCPLPEPPEEYTDA